MDRIKNTELFLASSSPRRKELLAKLGIPFKVAAFDTGEKVPDGMTAESAVEYLACLKARCAAERACAATLRSSCGSREPGTRTCRGP